MDAGEEALCADYGSSKWRLLVYLGIHRVHFLVLKQNGCITYALLPISVSSTGIEMVVAVVSRSVRELGNGRPRDRSHARATAPLVHKKVARIATVPDRSLQTASRHHPPCSRTFARSRWITTCSRRRSIRRSQLCLLACPRAMYRPTACPRAQATTATATIR